MASAQQPSVEPGSQSGAELPSIALRDELPWLMRRAALLELRLNESPKPSDYALCANLLSLASELDPDNAELARDVAQAAWLAGDSDLMLEATRRVIKIDPKDSMAQLRLISANINKKQTVEERKALYDRFLSDAGESLDPSVRSRLALDAALLEREMGNTSGFIERLHQSTRLDITNKAAASLAAQFYSSVRDNPVTNFDYQLRLLNADPLDANVYLTITRMLASQGALEESQRFLDNAVKLFKLESGEISSNIEEITIAIEWQLDGPAAFLDRLSRRLNELRVKAQSVIQAYEERQLPTDDLMRPEAIRYNLGLDKLRLLAAHSQGETQLVRSILTDIQNSVDDHILQLATAAQTSGVNMNVIVTQVVVRVAELQAMRAIVGLDADLIRRDIDRVIELQPAMAQSFSSIECMALYAEGRYEESLAATEANLDSPIVGLIRAQCLERLDRQQEAIDLYVRIAHSNPLDVYGAFASTRAQSLGAGDRLLTDAGKTMATMARKVPDWLDQMIDRPSSFQFLRIEQDQRLYRENELPMLTITLQNTAPIPLALGPNAPLESRILIEPVGVKTLTNGFVGETKPKVLQIDHRLRLMPREELVFKVVGDSATTDWLIDQQPGVSMRQRWRLIQGYRPRVTDSASQQQNTNPDAKIYGITNSPLGLTAETQVVQRLGLSVFRADPNELVAMLNRGDSHSRRRAVLAINARLMSNDADDALDETAMGKIVEALNNAFTGSSSRERAAMLLALPHRHQVPAMIEFDDHVAALLLSDALIDSEADPVVLACALLTRTDDPEAPIFETLAHVNDERVQRLAAIVQTKLKNNEPLLGTVGPGLDAVTPSFDGLGY
ncbi:MAG: tetratricopeptide repeat protein [Phycisphaerales bacterium JB052]